MRIEIPYGHTTVSAEVGERLSVETLLPPPAVPASDPAGEVAAALERPLGGAQLPGSSRVAVAINDKTRPVPHGDLLPPLLRELEARGVKRQNINLIIATGTHPVMAAEEYREIVPPEIVSNYRITCHDGYDKDGVVDLGRTSRGTPCTLNRAFAEADYRIVVGNIEPHQFMGFSGGVKSAAIGLAGVRTVNANHALMSERDARLGVYARNPARLDVEELGTMVGVDFALNAVLTQDKRIVRVLAGDPGEVMRAGIPEVLRLCTVPVKQPFDAMIVSPGGHPKDINVYQTQKGLAHASAAARPGAPMVLAAACPQGAGSEHYERWVSRRTSQGQVLEEFSRMEFEVGPHKAFQIARDAADRELRLVSEMSRESAERLLFTPADSLQQATDELFARLPDGARVGVMARANATIPRVE